MSSRTTDSPAPSGHPDPGWGTIAVRTLLVVAPSLLVGFVVGAAVFGPASLDRPALGWAINVVPGLLAGLGLGLILRPHRQTLGGYVAVSAVVGAAVVAGLLALASLRVPGTLAPAVGGVLAGLLITVGVQTVLALALWRLRGARQRTA